MEQSNIQNVIQSTVSLGKECVICYESLNAAKNFCVTECGHEFCFSCMMKHVQRNNGCPMCRTTIIEDVEDSDSEDDEEYETDESGSDDESVDSIENGEDLENEYPIEQLEAAFVAKGYGLKDALSLLMYKFSKTDEKYTKAYIKQLEEDIDEMNEELQNECDEREDMGQEDTREEDIRTQEEEEEPNHIEAEFQAMIATLD
jgi:hypothetical protein